MGHAEIVAFLLRKGANPRLCDADGMTALHKVITPMNQQRIQTF